jgi:predicted TIM-barrel fold metal-dependent hydrolase
MIIDSHAHIMLPQEKQIQWMDEAGVDLTVLFASTIHPETATTLIELETEMNKLYDILNGVTNPQVARVQALEQLGSVVNAAPDRYIGFGSIPFGLSYHENLAWIDKHILANHFRGIGELTPQSGQIQQMEGLFQAAQALGGLPLWVHAFFPLNFNDIHDLLILAKKYPTVPTIIGHLGGIHWLATLRAIGEIPNTYLDLSATFTTMAPCFALKEFPARTLFSSDAPYSSPLVARLVLEQLTDDKSILDQVLGENIANLLKL